MQRNRDAQVPSLASSSPDKRPSIQEYGEFRGLEQAAGWERPCPLRQQSTDTGGKRLVGKQMRRQGVSAAGGGLGYLLLRG